MTGCGDSSRETDLGGAISLVREVPTPAAQIRVISEHTSVPGLLRSAPHQEILQNMAFWLFLP